MKSPPKGIRFVWCDSSIPGISAIGELLYRRRHNARFISCQRSRSIRATRKKLIAIISSNLSFPRNAIL